MAEITVPQIEWRLRIGTKISGFIVRPDSKWPGMWRIHAPNGKVSDMVNPTRAKDACIGLTKPRGLGPDDRIYWDPREIAPEPPK